MEPIVNGLEQEYGDQMLFLKVNALDGGNGEAAFNNSRLPGHPAFLIFQPDGEELWRSFGDVSYEQLSENVDEILSP